MKINSENKQRIHDVLLTDMQRRIFKQYNERTSEFLRTDEDYDVTQELLVNKVLHCDSLNDVNDMLVTALGAFVDRIHKDETVAIGDYLQSKGDGTAKKQADDILRASTVGKVTSTEKIETHADGSYCVPCTLHCG